MKCQHQKPSGIVIAWSFDNVYIVSETDRNEFLKFVQDIMVPTKMKLWLIIAKFDFLKINEIF